jgi:outer membrane protein W
VPVSDHFISKTSFAGGYSEYRMFIRPDLSLGFGLSINYFNQYVSDRTYTSKDEPQAITTDMMRLRYTFPMTFSAQYYFSDKKFAPYAGLGIGAQFTEQVALFNYYRLIDPSWGFVIRPSVGALVKFSEDVGGHVSIGYNLATNKDKYFDGKSLQYVYFELGFYIAE